MNPTREDATSGEASVGKLLRRNVSPARVGSLLGRGFRTLKDRGWQALGREIAFRVRLASGGEIWRYKADIPLNKELRAQRRARFAQMPLISIVAPLYKTPTSFLTNMVNSVLKQSYANWELILVDGSGPAHGETAAVAAAFEQKDSRIRLHRLYKNKGIAGNTNIGLSESQGAYIALLDHDDTLPPMALYEVAKAINETGADLLYSDEIVLDETLKKLHAFHCKPDFGPDTLRGCNFITHLCVFSRGLLARTGPERPGFEGAQDYDFVLRLTEKAHTIVHIPKFLYHWRQHDASTAKDIGAKPQAIEAGAKALQQHLDRLHLDGVAEPQAKYPGAYRVHYQIEGNPKVSVVIPNKDHSDDLKKCLDSLYTKAGWKNFEVLVVENNSEKPETEAFYRWAAGHYPGLRLLQYRGGFNFAAICNHGAARATGAHLLLLNNDIEVIENGFVRELLCYSQRPDVGAVGPLLYDGDDEVQHAGLFIGIGGSAGGSHKGWPMGDGGSLFRLATAQNVSAVTGAALMVKTSLYRQLSGMDEQNFAVAFNDVDFCLRLREKGLLNVFTPFALAHHYESKSRGYDTQGPAKERFEAERARFRTRWAALIEAGDPYYNPHLTLETENYAMK